MNRWPGLLLVFALIGGLVFADQRVGSDEATAIGAVAPAGAPSASDASGSTWYCPAGFTTPDSSNDHIVVVTNDTDIATAGALTLYPSLLDTLGNAVTFERAVQPIEVAARSQQRFSLAPLVATMDDLLATDTGAYVGVLAEFEAPGITVEHAVVAPQGSELGGCATTAASRWWFASGTTTADVGYQLYLLNPFPDDAVVDITFVTDGGTRKPTAFDGRLVPAQSLTVIQVSPVVPVWEQLTAQITTRKGRVIAERIQLYENVEGPAGLSMSLGASELSEQWFFPAGRAVPGAGESYIIYNPGDEPAEVEFEVKPDSSDRAGDLAALQVDIGSRERWIVNVNTHGSHPVDSVATIDATAVVEPGEQFFASVRSFNGVPVVVERLHTRPLPESGVSVSLGIDRASTDQQIALPATAAEADFGTLAVLNPAGNTISRITILVGGPGGEREQATVELGPRRRAVFSLASLELTDDQWIRIVSTTGTMAELVMVKGNQIITNSAVPAPGTTSIPDLLAFD